MNLDCVRYFAFACECTGVTCDIWRLRANVQWMRSSARKLAKSIDEWL